MELITDNTAKHPQTLVVPLEADYKRLDQVLGDLLGPEISRSQIQRLLKTNQILVDGKAAKASQKACLGQIISITWPEPDPLDLIPQALPLDVIYEDDSVIVINKQPGLVVHPAPGHNSGTLVHGLLHHCQDLSGVGGIARPGIVHRLDKDTSGVIIVAKSQVSHQNLVNAFACGQVSKQYLALVWGWPPAQGEICKAIGRHPKNRKRMSSLSSLGKPAHSVWQVINRFAAKAALLKVNIHTGRTHQIRVHLSEAGFPIVGDQVYGLLRPSRQSPKYQALLQANRQMLHALTLQLKHPVTNQPLSFTAPLPPDFRRLLHALYRQRHA